MEITASLVAFLVTALGIYKLAPLSSKFGLVDHPNHRKRHLNSTPVVGGIAIYLCMIFVSVILLPMQADLVYFLSAAGLIVMAGVADDRHDINFRIRLLLQIVSILIIIYGTGNKLTSFGDILGFGPVELGIFSVPITIIAFLTVINAFNMIDGLDGLAGGLALVAITPLALIIFSEVSYTTQVILCVFIASLCAYLVSNLQVFPILPKVFLGDAGSTLIGFIICSMLIRYSQDLRQEIEPVFALWLVALPVFDIVTTTSRRLKNKKSPFKPDRTHIHHIFIRAGFSPKTALLLIHSLAVFLAIVGSSLELVSAPVWLSFLLFAAFGFTYRWYVGKIIKLKNRKKQGKKRAGI